MSYRNVWIRNRSLLKDFRPSKILYDTLNKRYLFISLDKPGIQSIDVDGMKITDYFIDSRLSKPKDFCFGETTGTLFVIDEINGILKIEDGKADIYATGRALALAWINSGLAVAAGAKFAPSPDCPVTVLNVTYSMTVVGPCIISRGSFTREVSQNVFTLDIPMKDNFLAVGSSAYFLHSNKALYQITLAKLRAAFPEITLPSPVGTSSYPRLSSGVSVSRICDLTHMPDNGCLFLSHDGRDLRFGAYILGPISLFQVPHIPATIPPAPNSPSEQFFRARLLASVQQPSSTVWPSSLELITLPSTPLSPSSSPEPLPKPIVLPLMFLQSLSAPVKAGDKVLPRSKDDFLVLLKDKSYSIECWNAVVHCLIFATALKVEPFVAAEFSHLAEKLGVPERCYSTVQSSLATVQVTELVQLLKTAVDSGLSSTLFFRLVMSVVTKFPSTEPCWEPVQQVVQADASTGFALLSAIHSPNSNPFSIPEVTAATLRDKLNTLGIATDYKVRVGQFQKPVFSLILHSQWRYFEQYINSGLDEPGLLDLGEQWLTVGATEKLLTHMSAHRSAYDAWSIVPNGVMSENKVSDFSQMTSSDAYVLFNGGRMFGFSDPEDGAPLPHFADLLHQMWSRSRGPISTTSCLDLLQFALDHNDLIEIQYAYEFISANWPQVANQRQQLDRLARFHPNSVVDLTMAMLQNKPYFM